VLVAGEGPHVLTLAYYIAMTNPDAHVTIALPEEGSFRDQLLGIDPIFTERSLTALGCEITTLRSIDVSRFDRIVDVMSYSVDVEGDHDCVVGLGTIEQALAQKLNLPICITEEQLDSDVLKYVSARAREKIREHCTKPLKVRYGIKHVEHRGCTYVGYGLEVRYGVCRGVLKDVINVHRHCILTGITIGLNLNVDIREVPFWHGAALGKIEILTIGPTTRSMLDRGIMTTSISMSTEDSYMKILAVYRQNIVGVQIVREEGTIENIAAPLYSMLVSDKFDALRRLLFTPVLFRGGLRTWVDHMIEMSIREMYWLFYT